MRIRSVRQSKRELFSKLTSEIAVLLKKKRLTEKNILQDFARWQEERLRTRRVR